MAKAIETGLPKMRIEEAAARRQAHIDSGKETIVGVNKYRPEREMPMEILEVDNTAVREAQSANDCRTCGRNATSPRSRRHSKRSRKRLQTGEGNLLALAVEAARARASLGEISDGHGKGVRAGIRP